MTLPPETRFSVAVSTAERLDRFLADQLDVSRTVAARLIADKRVCVKGVPVRSSFVPEQRVEIVVTFPEEPPRRIAPFDLPLDIVYEDEALAVVDKPAGLVVHPAPGHWEGTLVNALAPRGPKLGGGGTGRPGSVHPRHTATPGPMAGPKPPKA